MSKVCSKVFRGLYSIRQIRQYLSEDATNFLAHFSVTSRLDNCDSMLFDIPKYQQDRLERILNSAARNVCLVRTFSHHTPVLYNLHWLPVPHRIQFKILLLVHPALFGVAPVYLKKLPSFKESGSYNLRSKLSCEFKVP